MACAEALIYFSQIKAGATDKVKDDGTEIKIS